METSVLTSKGQLLIPKRLRNKYGIRSGVRMILEETEHGVLITPMNEEYFRSFAGILKKTGAIDEELRKMKEEEEKHEERKANLHLKTTKKHK